MMPARPGLRHCAATLFGAKAAVSDDLTVSPEERSIVYSQLDQSESDLFLVERFK
jgi:hypothetical protein